jgi:hypothetical protein
MDQNHPRNVMANEASSGADDAASPPFVQPGRSIAAADSCPEAPVTHAQELVDNLPYLAMILLGTAVFWVSIDAGVWRWLLSGLYLVYGIAGALWVMLFICPYCHFYDTRLCPCGYGRLASRLRARKDGERFARQFRKHIPVIVPLWFAPLAVGSVALFREFSWVLLVLLVTFVVNSFVVLPLVSRKYGCAKCPQKEACPWMGTCRTEA